MLDPSNGSIDQNQIPHPNSNLLRNPNIRQIIPECVVYEEMQACSRSREGIGKEVKSPGETQLKKKENNSETERNPSPRDPLKDLNGASATHSGHMPPRRGCFNFCRSGSGRSSGCTVSSSAVKSISKPSFSPDPRALASARVAPKSSTRSRSRAHPTNPSKSGIERPKMIRQKTIQKPKGHNSAWKGDSGSRRLFQKSSARKGEAFEQVSVVEMECSGDRSEVRTTLSKSTPENEEEKTNSNSPMTVVTPPIHPSISPELACGNSMLPTPSCLAAGHLLAGIPDRRKCKPRGILKVGDGGVGVADPNSSSTTLPLVKASMQWLSSPSQLTGAGHSSGSDVHRSINLEDFAAEASMKWLLSSPSITNVQEGDDVSRFDIGLSTGYDSWRISPAVTDDATVISPEFGCLRDAHRPNPENTPMSKFEIWRTPTTGSSVSPFSMIVRKAAASSCSQVIGPEEGIQGHRYDHAIENSPMPEESFCNGNLISTPLSNTTLERQTTSSSLCEQWSMDDSVPIAQSFSPRILARNDSRIRTDVSFEFGYTATDSYSIDLTEFRKSPSWTTTKKGSLHMGSLSDSTIRISWREGLLSRMFDMHELETCLRFSDASEDTDLQKENLLHSKQDVDCDHRGQAVEYGFGSIVLLRNNQADKSCDEKNEGKRIGPCLESTSIDASPMDSSSDSDWKMFFKNDLFEF